jgi:hypothetical protein
MFTRMKKLSKRTKESVFLIPGVLVFGVLVVIYPMVEAAFWQSFFSNFLATMLGAVVGIPTAIWLSNQQRKMEDAAQKSRIIPLLQEELLVNTTHLSSWQKSDFQKLETLYTGIFLEDGIWSAFSASGELGFIHDPQLLKHLGHAYGSIRIVKNLSERYIKLTQLIDRNESELLLNVIGPLLAKGVGKAIEDIRTAFLAISKEQSKKAAQHSVHLTGRISTL